MASKFEQDPERARARWFGRWALGGLLSLGCASSTAPASSGVGAQDGGAPVVPPPVASVDGSTQWPSEAVKAEAGTQRSCPPEMVYVPGGTFMMGDKEDPNAPLHKVTLTKPYCIDRLEVTLEDYQTCEKARACTKSGAPKRGAYGGGFNCTERWERNEHPINCITWLQASVYCRWAKKRLPSEAEWEFAARGPKSFRWPWGNQPPRPELAWNNMYEPGADGTTEVGKRPAGASPFGVLDMGGSVTEWVQDWNVFEMGANKDDAVDPIGPANGDERVIKDISWAGGVRSYNMGRRGSGRPSEDVFDTVGVRCALTAP